MTLPSDRPTSDEIRAALARLLDSPSFRGSPQLSAFLRFVAEAELAGKPDRIKGYTIAVEALGREPDFDPQTDPIVRVEAARLRRAIERYYTEEGATETVIIDIPRGSYVPVFRRAGAAKPKRPSELAQTFRRFARRRPTYSAVLALVLGVLCLWVAFDTLVHDRWRWTDSLATGSVTGPAGAPAASSYRYSDPTLHIAPMRVVGTPPSSGMPAIVLEDRLRDAFARSDNVTLVSATATPAQQAAAHFQLISYVEYQGQTANLGFRIVEAAGNTVIWGQSFENVGLRLDEAPGLQKILREVVTRTLQPFGTLYARERIDAASKASTGLSPFQCIDQAYILLRTMDRSLFAETRNCLERLTASGSDGVIPYILLAQLCAYEPELGISPQAGERPALDRALLAVNAAIRISPESARANAVKALVLFMRKAVAEAIMEGNRALGLNPYDLMVNFYVGVQLVSAGEIERGRALLQEFLVVNPIPAPRARFALFAASYLDGDFAAAERQVGRMAAPTFARGWFARALLGAKTDNPGMVRTALEQLYALQPAWKDDPHGQIGKVFYTRELIERFAADYQAAVSMATH